MKGLGPSLSQSHPGSTLQSGVSALLAPAASSAGKGPSGHRAAPQAQRYHLQPLQTAVGGIWPKDGSGCCRPGLEVQEETTSQDRTSLLANIPWGCWRQGEVPTGNLTAPRALQDQGPQGPQGLQGHTLSQLQESDSTVRGGDGGAALQPACCVVTSSPESGEQPLRSPLAFLPPPPPTLSCHPSPTPQAAGLPPPSGGL